MEKKDKNIASDPNLRMKAFLEKQKSLTNEELVYKAGELINEISEVEVDEAYLKVEQRINRKSITRTLFTHFSRYAAILIIPLIVYTVWVSIQKPITEQVAFHEITCPVGIRSQVVLPDGSEVWLNSESSIKYSVPFVRKTRTVELEGEAFLHVAKNESSPFAIQSGKVKVDVVGTQFNFKSYPEDNTVEVVLQEGRIDLSVLSDTKESAKIKMKPGDYFSFNRSTGKGTVLKRNIDKYVGWKENKLIFDDTPLPEVARMLKRWYGVDVEIADKEIENYKFTTTFMDVSLSQVIELLELSSPIRIEYFPGKVNKKTNQAVKAKIRISKK